MLIALAAVVLVAVAAVAVFFLTQGNGNNDSPADEGKAVNVKCDPYTITDSLGNTYTFDHTFGAVAVQWSISGGPFVTMAALLGNDLPKYLVGIDSTPSLYRMDSWEAYCKSMPALKSLPVIGDIGTDWDSTKVLSLSPTALILPERVKTDAENGNVIETFSKAGIPIIYVDFHREDIDTIKNTINNLGKMFGKQAKAKELADLYESKAKPIYEKTAGLIARDGYIEVYNETGQLGPSATGQSRDNTQDWGKLIYECGGNSIAAKTGKLDMSYVLTKDPDRIFFAGSYWPNQPDSIRMGFGVTEAQAKKTVDKYFEDRAGWKSLSAYKDGGVYMIAHCLGRDIYDYCALEFIANMIWPDEFNYNPAADLKAFYDKYLPFDFGGTWFMKYDSGESPGPVTGKATNVPCAPYTVTDLAGQTFTFDHTFGAVATQWSISGGPFITMAALLGDDVSRYMVGIDNTPPLYRADSWEAYCNNIPGLSDLELIGGIGSDFDAVKVLTMKPNALIISVDQKTDAETNNVVDTFAKAKIPVIYVDFHSQDVQKSAASIRLIGKLFGKSAEAEDLASFYEQKCNAVYSRVAQILASGKERPLVHIEVAQKGPSAAGNSYNNNYMWGGLVYKCGGQPLFNGTGSSGALDSAFVLSSDPDKILFTGSLWPGQPESILMGFTAAEDITKSKTEGYFEGRAGWKNLSAYKNGEVYDIYHSLSRDAYDYTAIEYIAKILWPEEFKDLDPLKDLQGFYRKYLGFDLYGTWFYHFGSGTAPEEPEVPVDGNGKAINVACAPYTFTDLAGQTFTFDHTFGAVATQTTGSGGPFFGIAALVGDDLPKYLVGLDGGFKNRMDLYNAYLNGMPELKELPNIGAVGTDWDNSRVLLLGPNALIVNLGSKSSIESNGVKSAFDKAGIPIVYINYHTESIEDITKSIRIMGMMFGKQERAEQLASLYETKAGQVYDRVAQILASGKERPTIFIECANGGPDKIGNSYPTNSMWGAIAYNLGANVLYNRSESYAPLDEPFILSSDPQRILFTGSFWDSSVTDYIAMGFTATPDLTQKRVDGYFNNRGGWKSLDAYRNDQVYVIYHGLSRDVWDYAAIEFVAKVIWPEEFADLDPAKDLEDFYKEYMPFDLYGNWFHHYTK